MTDLAQRPHHPVAAPVGRWEAWRTRARRFRELAAIALRSPTTVIGLVLILALVTMAICAPLIMEPNFPDPYQMPRDWAHDQRTAGDAGSSAGHHTRRRRRPLRNRLGRKDVAASWPSSSSR